MTPTPPPVSETAAPDEFLEHIRKYRDAAMFASRHGSQQHAEQRDEHWAWIVAEIRRLRADNERHEATILDLRVEVASLSAQNERLRAPDRPCNRCAIRANELDALRSELAAATRERETPPDDSPNSLGVQLTALEARDFQRINDPRATPIPPAPAEGGFERVGEYGIRPCRGHWHVTCLNDDGTEGDDIAIRGDPFRDRDAAYRAALAENPPQR